MINKTLILVHGFLRTKYSMLHLGPIFSRQGYRVLNFHYFSLRGTIDLYSLKLAEFIRANVPADYELNFITHSLGSIILRKTIQEHHLPHKLGRAVMLGPPNKGSELARKISKSAALRKLLGPTLLELAELNLPEHLSTLEVGIISGASNSEKGISPYLSGPNDGTVLDSETALSTAKETIKIPKLHSIMMYSPEIVRQISHFLEQGSFIRPTPSS